METPISWQAEARRMRAQGKASDEIAALLSKPPSAVREVLRGARRPPPAVFGAGTQLVEPHVPRVPRVILNADLVRSAAVAFAKGEITKDELMRRISR